MYSTWMFIQKKVFFAPLIVITTERKGDFDRVIRQSSRDKVVVSYIPPSVLC